MILVDISVAQLGFTFTVGDARATLFELLV
jgi:hypothetical protein